MADKYANFAALELAEPDGAINIHVQDTQSSTLIIAPHGGKIEPGTSEIAKAIASDCFRLYLFEGCKKYNNMDLHITSTRFDEPRASDIVARSDYVVAIHGCVGSEGKVYIGGLDRELGSFIGEHVRNAGFDTGIHTRADLQGTSSRNICNRGRRGRGVQLEISRSLRNDLRGPNGREQLTEFGVAIRGAIQKFDG